MLRTLGILITVQAVSLLIPSENDCHRLLLAVQVVVAIYLFCSILTQETETNPATPERSGGETAQALDAQHASPRAPAGLIQQYAVLQFLEQVEERHQNRRDREVPTLW